MAVPPRDRRPVVVHVGPSRSAKGGIARTIALYAESPLVDWYDMRFVASMGPGTGPLRHLWAMSAVAKVASVCAAHRGAIVHLHIASHGSFARKSLIGSVAMALGGRVVAHVHGGGFADFAARGGPARTAKVLRLLGRASAVLALSAAWAARIEELGVSGVTVVANPVVVPPQVSGARGSRRILFIGHLVSHKGIETLSAAIGLLSADDVDADVSVLGAGPGESLLHDTGSVSVHHRGWVDPDEVQRELAHGAVFVLPSLVEGVPLALLESMAYGLACVCTAVGGVPDVVSDGVNGRLVPAGDARALADALRGVLEDPDFGLALGDEARAYVIAHHSIEVVAEQVAAVYESVLGSSNDSALARGVSA